MDKKLTKPQLEALKKYEDGNTHPYRAHGINRRVADRLVILGMLTSTGSWSITPAGRAKLAKDTPNG